MAPQVCRLFLSAIFLLPAVVHAGERHHFSLSAGPLAQSLEEYSRVVGGAVVFDPREALGVMAPALKGVFGDEEALQRLLTDTSLTAERLEQGWLIVARQKLAEAHVPAPAPTSPRHLEEIRVTGNYRGALGAASAKKQAADRHLDLILAEDMGRFPVLNVAEAINRSAGVSVVRDRGEALFISLRGLPTQFNQITLNGRPLASNENVRTSEQYGRRFHYSLLPAELVSSVEIRKSASAADTAGSIGGSVDLQTFKPLENVSGDGAGHAFMGSAAGSYSPHSGDTAPRLSALGSWVSGDGSLGLSMGAAYAERGLRQDRALNFRWSELEDGRLSPGGLRPTLELEESQRLGLSAAVQWRPDAASGLDINLLDLRRHSDYREFSYSADYDPQSVEAGSQVWRGDALVGGDTESGSVQIGRESAGIADSLRALYINFESSRNAWHYQAGAALSRARSYNDDPIKRTRLRRDGDVSFTFRYPRSGGSALPEIHYQNLALTNPDDFPGRRLEWRRMDARDDSASADFSAQRDLDGRFFRSIEGGVQWRYRARRYQRRDALITEGIAGEIFSSEYFSSLPVNNFLEDAGLPQQWLVPDEARFWQSVDTAALAQAGPSPDDLLNSYRVAGSSRAFYLRADFGALGSIDSMDSGPWRGDLGLRYVHSTRRARGYRPAGDGEVGPAHFENTDGILLPSANFTLDLGDDLVWRMAVARVINRPDLQDQAPRLTLNSGDINTAVGGNPELEAVEAWQYDGAFEWYFSPHSLFSLGLFYTELEGFIQTQTSTVSIGGEDYELTAKGNGGSARVSGLELDYQQLFARLPAPWNGLGIQANFALTDSRAEYRQPGETVKDQLAEVAPRTFNLGVFYETPGFGIHLHYNWRGRVLEQVGSYSQAAQNSEPFGTLDARLSISLGSAGLGFVGLGKDVRFFAEGINLTGAAERESIAGGEFAGYSYYGRTVIAGLKVSL